MLLFRKHHWDSPCNSPLGLSFNGKCWQKKKKLILGQWKRPGVGQGPNSKLQADKKDADQYIRLSETEGKRGRTLIPIMPPNLRTLVAKVNPWSDSEFPFYVVVSFSLFMRFCFTVPWRDGLSPQILFKHW